MKSYPFFFLILMIPGLNTAASSFQTTLDKLSVVDPEFVVHVNLESDFNDIGAFFSEVYSAYLAMSPGTPPIPIDFEKLFGHLGLTGITSATWTSHQSGDGFINQALIQFAEAPKGIFLLTGEANEPFDILKRAPADADLIAEINFNGLALYGIVRDIVIDLMGPMGQGLIDAQMNQPVITDGPTLADLINRLSTKIQLAVQLNNNPMPGVSPMMKMIEGNAVIRIANVADLLGKFAPMLQAAGINPIDGEPGSYLYRSPNPAVPVSIFLHTLKGSNDLLVSFSKTGKSWFMESGTHITDTPEFMKVIEGLPLKGTSFWYNNKQVSEVQIDGLDSGFPVNEQIAPLINSLKSFLKGFSGSQAGVAFLEGNAHRQIAFQPTSYKANLAVTAAILPVAAAAAVIPMLQKNMAEPGKAEDSGEGEVSSPPN